MCYNKFNYHVKSFTYELLILLQIHDSLGLIFLADLSQLATWVSTIFAMLNSKNRLETPS